MVLLDIVGDVDDQTLLFSPVQGTTQSSTDHLLVQVRAERRPSDVDRSHCGRVETLREDSVVGKDTKPSRSELVDVVSPCAAWSLG